MMKPNRGSLVSLVGRVLFALGLVGGSPLLRAATEAFEVTDHHTGTLPRGKEPDGIVGDFLLRNDRVEAVIAGNRPLRRANMSTFYGATGMTPGCLYDLTLRGKANDQSTIFAPADQRGEVSWVRLLANGAEGEAVVETFVTAAQGNGLSRRHLYRLRDGWPGVLIETTLINEGDAARDVSTDDRWTVFQNTGELAGIQWAEAIDPADAAGYAYAAVGAGGLMRRGLSQSLDPERRQHLRDRRPDHQPGRRADRVCADHRAQPAVRLATAH